MPVKSRRIKNAVTDGNMPENMSYCRKCTSIKRLDEFHKAVDTFLDTNGLFSICKACINTIFENMLSTEAGSIQKATYRVCKLLNVKYDEIAIESALKQIESRNWSFKDSFFGTYRAKLLTGDGRNMTDANTTDLTFQDNVVIQYKDTMESDVIHVDDDVKEFWGEGYSQKDYYWLEKTLADWKKTHKSDTQAEETLLREIVFIQFAIKQARRDKGKTAALVKELQEVMKTAAIDPSKANMAGAGKSIETISAFIKMIEENDPADYYKDKELFKDYDDIGRKYFIPYVTRPLKNFVVEGSRDFSINGSENDEDDSDYFDDLSLLNGNNGEEDVV